MSVMQFTYRNADFNDIEQLKTPGWNSYRQYAPLLTEEHRENLKTNMANTETWRNILEVSTGFVCVVHDEIVGMAFLVPHGNPWDMFKSEWSYLRMVGVNPIYGGQGIAKKLTRMCIDHAIATGEQTIALHTSELMNAARHIYENFGFKLLYEIPRRLGVRYWIYTLELKPGG